jgi:hypothetical protein
MRIFFNNFLQDLQLRNNYWLLSVQDTEKVYDLFENLDKSQKNALNGENI